MKNSIIIFAPHQDDETIGCGGLIQVLACKGYSIDVVISTRVEKSFKSYKDEKSVSTYLGAARDLECINALEVLGIKERNLSYLLPAKYHMRLDQLDNIDILLVIEKLIKEIMPISIFIPARSLNQDHNKMHECLLSAARPHFYHGNVIMYEVENEIDFNPNLYVALQQEQADRKICALQCYNTQIKNKNSKINKEYILNKLKYRGSDISCEYAEAFQILRYRFD